MRSSRPAERGPSLVCGLFNDFFALLTQVNAHPGQTS